MIGATFISQQNYTSKVRWNEIQKCTDPDVQRELEDIHLNTSELFADYEEVEVYSMCFFNWKFWCY